MLPGRGDCPRLLPLPTQGWWVAGGWSRIHCLARVLVPRGRSRSGCDRARHGHRIRRQPTRARSRRRPAYLAGRAWTRGTGPLGADADFFFETYVVPAAAPQPPAPGKPAAGTLSAVAIRSLPAAPIAGAAFRVLPSIVLSTGRKVTPTNF